MAKADRGRVETTVREMLERIASGRDEAVRHYAKVLDKWEDERVSRVAGRHSRHRELAPAKPLRTISQSVLRNVTAFARLQRELLSEFESEISPGVHVGQKQIPVTTAGCYIPGGKYPLISAAIMSVATAKVAGVQHVTGCASAA